ncbi:MAG: hypothetical protein LBN95_03050 [Prevotellaceae bacterium]|jgi:hypothetical protein|nr:hypothetical protein [Prevotellaceae bacterium]
MINFKKMDDEDFVFLNKTSPQNDRQFSDFLKNRNQNLRTIKNLSSKRQLAFA